jgi:hypothetical protein
MNNRDGYSTQASETDATIPGGFRLLTAVPE